MTAGVVRLRERRPTSGRPPPGSWDGVVVICAGTPWNGVACSEHHLAEQLVAYGPVLYVDPPISHVGMVRNGNPGGSTRHARPTLLRDRLAHLAPVALPGLDRAGMHAITERLMRLALRRAVNALGGSVRALLSATPEVYFGACDEQLRVLYATDDWSAGALLMGVRPHRLERAELRLAHQADLVVTISEPLTAKWRALGSEPVLIPNGCDAEFLATSESAPLPPDVTLPAPIAGFIGRITDRIDLSLLDAVARTGISLLLVGPRPPVETHRFEDLIGRDNVGWVGMKPFNLIPSYLRVIDVGITPYANTAFNRASFPLKTLDYLAAGCPVVATDLPAVRWLDTDLITIASRPDEFADAVVRSVDDSSKPTMRERRRAFAARQSWAARAGEFARLLQLGTVHGRCAT
jgi:teichuronic acid biosynthesis glycosyltransferase TuaH